MRTFVVDSRQDRPNLPAAGCPFCPGGLEAPEDYDVRWFQNRWPAMPDDRCEVVLYTPQHDATFWSLGVEGARKVIDLWAERTAALGARADVDYVLVFENRGAAGRRDDHASARTDLCVRVRAGAAAARARSAARGSASRATGSSRSRPAGAPGSPRRRSSRTPSASRRTSPCRTCPRSTTPAATALAALLVDVLERFDRLFDAETPYMLWIHQRPFDGGDWPDARLHVEIVTPWRAPGVPRYVAAGELGSGVYFNPVAPEAAAQALRDAV